MNAKDCCSGPTGELTSYHDALQIVLDHCPPLGSERVPLGQAVGLYLASPVKARADAPRFEQSAMDGFAVRAGDLAAAAAVPVTLAISGEMPTGSPGVLTLRPGHTVRVFTGGRLPRGADTIVMVEHVATDGSRATFAAPAPAGAHIRRRGEEYRKGEEILPAGLRVTPPVIGVLASQGLDQVKVGRIPKVTVITMGDELLAPGEKPAPGRIHDANGPALVAALGSLGVTTVRHRRVGDTLAALKRSLAAALRWGNMVITVGGASVGDHDHAAAARKALGVHTLFDRLAVKPGKPNMFGLASDDTPVFSLPGNPVSALVGFHQLVKPALRKMMGCVQPLDPALPVALGSPVRKKPGRLHWLRARMSFRPEGLVADLASLQGSHMLSSLARGDMLVEIGREDTGARQGDVVPAILLDWDR